MKHIYLKSVIISLLCLVCLVSCSEVRRKKANMANLNLDIGIGISHFDNESDYPAPDPGAYLDVYSSRIVIRDAYGDEIIETPLIYNNSSTAYPRMKMTVYGNRIFVAYVPDISSPSLQFASTDDGGKSWIQSTLNLDSEGVGTIDNFVPSFWSTRNGAMIIANGMVDTFVYFTSDAGKTWQKADGAPPSQNWHDSLYKGAFLSDKIGFISYNYYSFSPSEPQIYITLDGAKSWSKLDIKVPGSVMELYSLAGAPYYDGEKIIVPIEIYNENSELSNTLSLVSYDFGLTWAFIAEESIDLEQIRNAAKDTWFAENRPAELADIEDYVSILEPISSTALSDGVRIDAYKLITHYTIADWRTFKLTGNMFFDENANVYYKDSSGFPVLLFAYEGDVFVHDYFLIGVSSEAEYAGEGEDRLATRLFEDVKKQRELKDFFHKACLVYSWFTGYTEQLTYTGESIEHGGHIYEKVEIEEIQNTAQLYDYISTFFSDEIAEKLITSHVDSEDTPLFIDGEDGLYRYSGYEDMFSQDSLTFGVSIADMSSGKATVTVSADTVFYNKQITFSYDCEIEKEANGGWEIKTFTLPAEKFMRVFSGIDTPDEPEITVDKTEKTITDINDWDKLSYSGAGGEQIRKYLEALISHDIATIAETSSVTTIAALGEYANFRFSSYTINKVYMGGQSRIVFEYTVTSEPENASPRMKEGIHRLAVSVAANGDVYLTEAETKTASGIEKYMSNYFSSTIEYAILNCSDLNYSQNYDITSFAIKSLGGTNVPEEKIKRFVYDVFGTDAFIPSEELRNPDGTFSSVATTQNMSFDITNVETYGDEINVTVHFYADRSKLVTARICEYKLKDMGDCYQFTGFYTSFTTTFNIYKTLS